MADTKRDILGKVRTMLVEMAASNTFESCGRTVSGSGAYATLMAADVALITTMIAVYSTVAAVMDIDPPHAINAAAGPAASAL